jgi:EmrB/QacA subfamily drug resistance transporter
MSTTIAATAPATVSERRRWLVLGVVCLGQLMMVLDMTIVNVALPAIQADLGFDQAGLTWVVDSYLITFGSFLLLAGRLGDLIGRKRMFITGVAVFTAASLLCGVAQSQAELLIGRFLQGLGSAGASSAVLALIVTGFPQAAERAKAMSVYTFVAVSGGSIGLVLGGALTQAIDWHWIFVVNLPVGLAALALGTWLIDDDRGSGLGDGVDVLGSVLMTAAMMVGIYAVVKVPAYGWGSLHTLGFGAAAGVLGAAFFALESRIANPILPPRVLRLRSLMDSSVVRTTLVSGMFAAFFLRSLYLERVEHYDPLQIGLSFLPQTLVVAALSLGVSAWLVGRFGAKRTMLPGMALMTIGLLILGVADEHTAYFPAILGAFTLMGFGAGISFMPLVTIALRDVPNEDAGLASAIVNVSMQIGGAFGLAVLGTIATSRTRALAAGGHSAVDSLVGGYQLAFLLAAGICALGAIYAARRLPATAPASEELGDTALSVD